MSDRTGGVSLGSPADPFGNGRPGRSGPPFADPVRMVSPEQPVPSPNLYWCIGCYASGSTWLFNAGKKIAAACGLQCGLASAFVTTGAELVFSPATRTAIVKTHETDDAAASTLAEHSQAIWLSVRDPRDSVTSLMLYQDCAFDEALEMTAAAAAACLPVLHHRRTRLFKFEDNFFDQAATLDAIAAGFGHKLTEATRSRIFAETRRSAVESFIGSFPRLSTVVSQPEPGHLVDLDTQWHSHHAGRDGIAGRWRTKLTIGQSAAIENRVADVMNFFGYRN